MAMPRSSGGPNGQTYRFPNQINPVRQTIQRGTFTMMSVDEGPMPQALKARTRE